MEVVFTSIARRLNGLFARILRCFPLQSVRIAAEISVLGSEESKQSTIKGLKSAEGYIRRQLAKNLNLRNTPEIRFLLDESIEYGVNMSRLIDDVIEHDHSKGTESEDGEKQDTAETEDEE